MARRGCTAGLRSGPLRSLIQAGGRPLRTPGVPAANLSRLLIAAPIRSRSSRNCANALARSSMFFLADSQIIAPRKDRRAPVCEWALRDLQPAEPSRKLLPRRRREAVARSPDVPELAGPRSSQRSPRRSSCHQPCPPMTNSCAWLSRILRQASDRLPGSYMLSRRLATTPSWPAARSAPE